MRPVRQFGLGFGFTLIIGSPIAATFLLAQPIARRARVAASALAVEAPCEPGVDSPLQPVSFAAPTMESGEFPEETDTDLEVEKTPLDLALMRLDRIQNIHGFWSDQPEHNAWLEEHSGGASLELDDTALTALCLLCLAQDGQSHIGAEQCNSCRIALTYLLSRGNGEGWYSPAIECNAIRTQALIISALTRLGTNSGDRSLEPVIEEVMAVADFCNTGLGWGRNLTDSKPDFLTTGWMLCAFKDDPEPRYDFNQSEWIEQCLSELEKQAKSEKGQSVMARAVYVACVEFGSERAQGAVYERAQEALLLRANQAALVDLHEAYWLARALKSSRSSGIWRDSIRAKAEAATRLRSEDEKEQWQGGEVYRLALAIRVLQTLK